MGPTSMARAGGLAFLTAAVTLFTQVLVHRMVSAKLLNNYAFVIISLTMLGFALSGVVLTRWLPGFLARLHETLAMSAALFVLSALAASHLFYGSEAGAPFAASRPEFVLALLRWIPLSLLYAVPFAFSGLVLGILLSSPHLPTRPVYFFDLLGSAVGAFAVIPAIGALGVEASLLAACGVMLVGTLLLAPPRGLPARVLSTAAALVLAFSAAFPGRVFDLYYPDGTMLAASRDPGSGVVVEHVAWDPVARIEVSRIPPPDPRTFFFPSLIGANRGFLSRFKRMLTQNNYAYTYAVEYDGDRRSLTGIEETLYCAAYHASSVARPRVLVIGAGAGFDVLSALYFDASEVTAVEVNRATVDILTRTFRDYFRRWVEDPRVRLVHGEGRHFLATAGSAFDVIQLSGVDSYSGTAGAAHVFSENYLYTAEAFDLYLSRLTEDGILNMMRLEFVPPREMLRALATAVGALRRAGALDPSRHVVMLTATNQVFTALLVKRTPFTEEEQRRLESWASGSRFFALSAGPRVSGLRENPYQVFLTLGSPEREARFVSTYPFDISPVDDNRPFFFKYSLWWHVFPSSPMIWGNVPVMEYSLTVLLAIIGIAAVAGIYVPLRYLHSQRARAPGTGRYGVFFAGIGLGYLAIEVALLQRFGLFLGHPNYALSVVLAALLLSTGLGSLFSEAIVRVLGGLRFVSYALAGLVLAEYGLAFPRLLALIGLPFAVKAALVFLLVAPVGLCLGTFFPTGLERLKPVAPAFAPWAWGINGIFSVLAPVLSVGFSMTWGINGLLLAALPVYLAVGFALPPASSGR